MIMKSGEVGCLFFVFAVLAQIDWVKYAFCYQIISDYTLINVIILSYNISCSAHFPRTVKSWPKTPISLSSPQQTTTQADPQPTNQFTNTALKISQIEITPISPNPRCSK